MSSENIKKMVSSLAHGKTSQANEYFAKIMTDKVNSVLDSRKISVASQIYSKKP